MIRVFPRRTKWTPDDELAFVGDPPLFLPSKQPVSISITFTWDLAEGFRLYRTWKDYFSNVQVGGPACCDPGSTFYPNLFIKRGITITSRGCPWKCPWCFVPKREGKIRELPIEEGWIVQDNNLLACSRQHIEQVFEMLSKQKQPIEFPGGLDGRFLTHWHIDRLKKLRIGQLWFACDHKKNFPILESVVDLTSDFPLQKKRCYVMIGFDGESLKDAEDRLEKVYSMGFLPFSQLYQGEDKKEYSKEWRNLNRKWSRPAAYRKKNGHVV